MYMYLYTDNNEPSFHVFQYVWKIVRNSHIACPRPTSPVSKFVDGV